MPKKTLGDQNSPAAPNLKLQAEMKQTKKVLHRIDRIRLFSPKQMGYFGHVNFDEVFDYIKFHLPLVTDPILFMNDAWNSMNEFQIELGVYLWIIQIHKYNICSETVKYLFHNFLNEMHRNRKKDQWSHEKILRMFEKHYFLDGLLLYLGSLCIRGESTPEKSNSICDILEQNFSADVFRCCLQDLSRHLQKCPTEIKKRLQ